MNKSRRSFIKNSSIIITGSTLLPHNVIFKAARKEDKLAIQLYSVDKEINENAAGTLKSLGKIGYKYVEHANYTSRKFYGYLPRDFKQLLSDCGLTLLSGHTVLEPRHWNIGAKIFTPEWHYTIEDAVAAGQQFLISPWLDRSLWDSEKGLKHFMDVFNQSGELCRKSGLQFGYHNHDFEFTHTFNSLRIYDIILQHTDAHLVSQQLDIGNIYQKDFSVNELFEKYPGRFELLHIKDVIETNERHQQYKSASIGKGILDIKNIMHDARQQGGTSCFIIEQDNRGIRPLETAKEDYTAFNSMKIISNPNEIKNTMA